MLTDRFIEFLKVEWNDFFGSYDSNSQKPNNNKSDESIFNQFYNFFVGETNQKTSSETDKQKAYEAYRRFRAEQQNMNNQAQLQRIQQEAKYFDALEIKPTKNFDEIKTAYKKAMKKYHPDRYAGDVEKQKIAQLISQKINEAYQYFEKKYNK
jgi:DnaJ-class molecular chaperone